MKKYADIPQGICLHRRLAALLVPSGISQDRDRDRRRENDQRGLVARVQADLGRVEHTTRAEGRERDRYQNARKHLTDFDQRLSARQFDKGRLDTAIDDLKTLWTATL